jgi:hypothetical protein
MNLPGLNLKDLTIYQQQLDLVKSTADQLIKDFEIFGFEIQFSGNNQLAYTELTSQVVPIIGKLINHDYERLLSLMYKIDLNEKEINIIISDFSKQETILEITHLILERELKKVVIKQYFKNQENQG